MFNFDYVFEKLFESPQITKSSLNQVSKQQGVYVLWLDKSPSVCLKVGFSGPRQGKGLKERLQYHFSNNPDNSILAEHMETDIDFGLEQGYDFRIREQRQNFLANECFFQIIPLPNWSKDEMMKFEKHLESRLNPRYLGKVGKKYQTDIKD